MTLTPVTPLKAQGLLGDGARLVDIRSPQEFADASVPGSENIPLGTIAAFCESETVIFVCRTGKRTAMNESELAALCSAGAYRIDGGLEAWRQSDLPVTTGADKQIGFEGAVLLVAGGLILFGLLFGWVRSAWWLILPAAIALDMILVGTGRSSVLAKGLDWAATRLRQTRQEP